MDIRRNTNRMSVFDGLPVQSEDINRGNIRADRKLLRLLQLSVVLLENSRGTSYCYSSHRKPQCVTWRKFAIFYMLNMNKISFTA